MNRFVVSLGGVGAGLVWGWSLAVFVADRPLRAVAAGAGAGGTGAVRLAGRRRGVAVAAASGAFGAEVALVAGPRAALAWSAAAVVGLVVHRRWRRSLLRRYGHAPGKGQVR